MSRKSIYQKGNVFMCGYGNGMKWFQVIKEINKQYVLTTDGIYSKNQLGRYFFHCGLFMDNAINDGRIKWDDKVRHQKETDYLFRRKK